MGLAHVVLEREGRPREVVIPLVAVFEKPIAVFVNRVNEGAAVGQYTELAPYAAQMNVDTAVIAREPPPERAQTELALAHRLTGMPQKHLQQAQFRTRKSQGLSQPLDAPLFGPQGQASGDQRSRRSVAICLRPAQDCADLGTEFLRRARLRDVAVGAELEGGNAVDIFAGGGQHEDPQLAVRADAPQGVQAARLGAHHIEDGEGVIAGQRLGDTTAHFSFDVDREAVPFEMSA
jgi:hypothetical protein